MSPSSQERGLELRREAQQAFGVQGLLAFRVIEVGRRARVPLLTCSVGPAGNQHSSRAPRAPRGSRVALTPIGDRGCVQRPAHGRQLAHGRPRKGGGGRKGLEELGMGKDRALNQVLQEIKPHMRQDIMFGPGGPHLVLVW